jgi:hypothetical protein
MGIKGLVVVVVVDGRMQTRYNFVRLMEGCSPILLYIDVLFFMCNFCAFLTPSLSHTCFCQGGY